LSQTRNYCRLDRTGVIHTVHVMNIEFDPAKNLANIAKHGIDLAFGRHVLAAADRTTIRDTRQEYGEERLISLGTVAGRVWWCTPTAPMLCASSR